MKTQLNVGARIQAARGKFRQYEGRLRQLEGRLRVIQGRAEQVRGRARRQWTPLEQELRRTIDAALVRLDAALKAVEPRVRRSLERTRDLGRGLRAGIKAGVAEYRRPRPK